MPAWHLSPSFAYLCGTSLHGEFAVVSHERAESCLLLGFRNEMRIAEGVGVSFGLHLDGECRVGSACAAAVLPAASLLAQPGGPWLRSGSGPSQVPQLLRGVCPAAPRWVWRGGGQGELRWFCTDLGRWSAGGVLFSFPGFLTLTLELSCG